MMGVVEGLNRRMLWSDFWSFLNQWRVKDEFEGPVNEPVVITQE